MQGWGKFMLFRENDVFSLCLLLPDLDLVDVLVVDRINMIVVFEVPDLQTCKPSVKCFASQSICITLHTSMSDHVRGAWASTDLVDFVRGRVRQNLAINIVEFDEAWVAQRFCLKQWKSCIGLLASNIPVVWVCQEHGQNHVPTFRGKLGMRVLSYSRGVERQFNELKLSNLYTDTVMIELFALL